MSNSNEPDKELRTKARNAYWNVAKDGLWKLIDEAPKAWKGKDAKYYRAEKAVILAHVEPFKYGCIIAGLLFVTFRVAGSQWYSRYILKRPIQIEKDQKKVWKSHLEREADKKKDAFREITQLPLDVFTSIMCGLSSILWLSKPKKIQRDLSEALLLPGQSLIHQLVCPDAIQAYHKLDRKVFQEAKDDNVVQAFQNLVRNCEVRADYIKKRKETGEERPDLVPYPGLQATEVVSDEST